MFTLLVNFWIAAYKYRSISLVNFQDISFQQKLLILPLPVTDLRMLRRLFTTLLIAYLLYFLPVSNVAIGFAISLSCLLSHNIPHPTKNENHWRKTYLHWKHILMCDKLPKPVWFEKLFLKAFCRLIHFQSQTLKLYTLVFNIPIFFQFNLIWGFKFFKWKITVSLKLYVVKIGSRYSLLCLYRICFNGQHMRD